MNRCADCDYFERKGGYDDYYCRSTESPFVRPTDPACACFESVSELDQGWIKRQEEKDRDRYGD